MKRFLRFVAVTIATILVLASMTWSGFAVWFTVTAPEWLRYGLIAGISFLALGGLYGFLVRNRYVLPLVPYTVCLLSVLVWFFNIEARNDRDWQPDVAVLPTAEIDGNFVTIRNIRNFRYRSETDYEARWYDKTVDLRKLDSVDLIAVYWIGDAIAHTILSFNFDGEYVAISIEIRKEKKESFSAIAGFFRRYELTYIVGDERDLIGLRTTYRKPKEDVYLYRVKPLHKENIVKLFLRYMAKINSLKDRPEFYNTATTNCTTNIVTHVEAARGSVPISWKMLLSGYFAELFYERGVLDKSQPFEVLKNKSLINSRARAADNNKNFSALIREGLIGISAK